MASNLNVKISIVATTPDGSPYFDSTVNYSNLPYSGLVSIEGELVTMLGNLVELGKAQVAADAASSSKS